MTSTASTRSFDCALSATKREEGNVLGINLHYGLQLIEVGIASRTPNQGKKPVMNLLDYMRRLEDLLAATDIIIKERDEARRERDEARREVLEAMHPDLRNGYANAREWDCIKEETP
jgi:hypothetical protein